MKKYKVTIPEVHTLIVEVAGDTPEDAFRSAEQTVALCGQDMCAIFERTMPHAEWKVEVVGDCTEQEVFDHFQKGELYESMMKDDTEEEDQEL